MQSHPCHPRLPKKLSVFFFISLIANNLIFTKIVSHLYYPLTSCLDFSVYPDLLHTHTHTHTHTGTIRRNSLQYSATKSRSLLEFTLIVVSFPPKMNFSLPTVSFLGDLILSFISYLLLLFSLCSLKILLPGNSLGAQWLGPCALTTEGPGLMEELILQTTQGGQK